MNDINLQIWYSDRELEFVPPHFMRVETTLSEESLFWVQSRLQGRYSVQIVYENNVLFTEKNSIYFEDPVEAMLFELRWSGTN